MGCRNSKAKDESCSVKNALPEKNSAENTPEITLTRENYAEDMLKEDQAVQEKQEELNKVIHTEEVKVDCTESDSQTGEETLLNAEKNSDIKSLDQGQEIDLEENIEISPVNIEPAIVEAFVPEQNEVKQINTFKVVDLVSDDSTGTATNPIDLVNSSGKQIPSKLVQSPEQVTTDKTTIPTDVSEVEQKDPSLLSVKELTRRYSSIAKNFVEQTTREKESAKEKEDRIQELKTEIKERESSKTFKGYYETMAEINHECESFKNF